MGLFDMFKGDKGEKMTPHLAFATSLMYMMSADGELDNEEIGHLLSVVGGAQEGNVIGVGTNNRELLDRAWQYSQKTPIDAFLAEVSPILTDAQKLCILTNLVDSSLSDGQAEIQEQQMFGKFLQAFGISEERFRPFFEVIALKHDRALFLDQNHPSNQPGFTVRLSQ